MASRDLSPPICLPVAVIRAAVFAAWLLPTVTGCLCPGGAGTNRAAGEVAAREAERLLAEHRRTGGYPYQFGGNPRYDGAGRIVGGALDCSALVQHCYRRAGVELPRVSRSQAAAGRKVSKRRLRRGDVLAFDTDGDGVINHVGLYAGGGRMIHTHDGGGGIVEADLAGHWRRALVSARRP